MLISVTTTHIYKHIMIQISSDVINANTQGCPVELARIGQQPYQIRLHFGQPPNGETHHLGALLITMGEPKSKSSCNTMDRPDTHPLVQQCQIELCG
jgi:hypothetical protein